MKWYFYIGTLILAFVGYWAVFPLNIEEPVGEAPDTKKAEPVETTFAEIDAQGTVLRVIVADQDFIDSGRVGDPKNWIETSPTIRKNPAGKGYTYDKTLDAFIPPKTASTTIFDSAKAQWIAPATIEKVRVATTTRI
jgi:hypothetical protein